MNAKMVSFVEVLDTVLEERATHIVVTDQDVENKWQRLLREMAEVDDAAAKKRAIEAALEALPPDRRAGWLTGVKSSLKLVVSEARRQSYLAAEAIQSAFQLDAEPWTMGPAKAMVARGTDQKPHRFESADQNGRVDKLVMVDDSGRRARIVAEIHNLADGQPHPVMLVMYLSKAPVQIREVDPQKEEDADGHSYLRYEAELEKGEYHICIGNPREV